MKTLNTPAVQMNISHRSNMGAVLRILTNSDDENDESDDKDDYVYPEASPEIKILIIYEQPQGTGLHMTFTLDPTITTAAWKKDLTNLIHVPAESIVLIHQNSILDDDKSLRSQDIQPNDTIVLRDTRLTYNFP